MFQQTSGPITIDVDPRIELIGMLFLQTSWQAIPESWDHYPYYQSIQHRLAPYLDHPAVQLAEQLVVEHHFIWDAIPKFTLFHGPPPNLDHFRPFDTYIISRAGGEAILHDLSTALRDLSVQIDFPDFFQQHGTFYQTIVNDMASQFQGQRLVQTLEGFFGWNQASYHVLLAPCMFPGGGNGLRIPEENRYHSYELARVGDIRDGMPYFGRADSIYDLALHEFAHSFVNPVTHRRQGDITALKPLYRHIESQLKQNVTYDWVEKFNEQVIHVFQLLVQQPERDAARVEKEIAECGRVGLYHTRELLELLEQYVVSREIYPRFDLFYPELIAFYENRVPCI